MLAGNRLRALPADDGRPAEQLELLRISANRFEALPDWLLALPRLSWLACAGNPFDDARRGRGASTRSRAATSTGRELTLRQQARRRRLRRDPPGTLAAARPSSRSRSR